MAAKKRSGSNERRDRKDFDPKNLWNSIIGTPLQQRIDRQEPEPIPVVLIDRLIFAPDFKVRPHTVNRGHRRS